MAGLQGSGKTTTSAKLGRWLKGRDRHPLLVSTDVQRPAAREQLRTIGQQAGVKVHHPAELDVPREIMESALREARAIGHDTVIVDTAGRLHIDDELMAELAELRELASPAEVLYVADALTGQDAVRSADEFHKKIGITGIVLTKLDGDSRGGAALSAASVTGQPVKFAGVGEKVDAFEPFDPARMVGAHPRPRRRAGADPAAPRRTSSASTRSSSCRSCGGRSSRSRTSATRCGRSARWARSTRSCR